MFHCSRHGEELTEFTRGPSQKISLHCSQCSNLSTRKFNLEHYIKKVKDDMKMCYAVSGSYYDKPPNKEELLYGNIPSNRFDNNYVNESKKYIINQYLTSKTTSSEIDKMTGEQFEVYIKWIFEKEGYRVEQTPRTGDKGVDLIASKGARKLAIQCKRYSNSVGVSAIQESFSGKAFYDCTEAYVVISSTFTNPAEQTGKKLGVVLWDREKLLSIAKKHVDNIGFDAFAKQFYYPFVPEDIEQKDLINLYQQCEEIHKQSLPIFQEANKKHMQPVWITLGIFVGICLFIFMLGQIVHSK